MPPTPDERADGFAARHHGLITRAAALAAGLTPRQIDRRLQHGRWIRIGIGLYRVVSARVTWQQRALGACLAGPPGTVASHLTAAALHGLAAAPARPHVIVPRTGNGRSQLAHVHRIDLQPRETLNVRDVPCTGVARTLIDCAGMVRYPRLCTAIDEAFCRGLSHPIALAEAIERSRFGRGKTGIGTLRRALAAWRPGIEPGSPPEVRLLRQVQDWGFPEPDSQINIVDEDGTFIGRIDLGWPARKVGLEYDGDQTHNPRAWDRDEGRQLRYEAAGWQVKRVVKYDLRPSVAWVRQFLSRALGAVAA